MACQSCSYIHRPMSGDGRICVPCMNALRSIEKLTGEKITIEYWIKKSFGMKK
jgi:hypothetical protein